MRLIDWEQRLGQAIENADIAAMGPAPCAKFVSLCVAAQLDIDIHAPFEGKYNSEIGAARALIKYGKGTLEATFDDLFPVRPIGFAQRGDVVFYDGSVGICLGAFALFINGGEFMRVPRTQWVKVWAVG